MLFCVMCKFSLFYKVNLFCLCILIKKFKERNSDHLWGILSKSVYGIIWKGKCYWHQTSNHWPGWQTNYQEEANTVTHTTRIRLWSRKKAVIIWSGHLWCGLIEQPRHSLSFCSAFLSLAVLVFAEGCCSFRAQALL